MKVSVNDKIEMNRINYALNWLHEWITITNGDGNGIKHQ